MRSLSYTLMVAGILLLLVAALPLIDFFTTLDRVSMEFQIAGTNATIKINYNDTAPLYDYNIVVKVNGKVVDSVTGAKLITGDAVTLKIPLESLSDKNITLSIGLAGKIYNVYGIELVFHTKGGKGG